MTRRSVSANIRSSISAFTSSISRSSSSKRPTGTMTIAIEVTENSSISNIADIKVAVTHSLVPGFTYRFSRKINLSDTKNHKKTLENELGIKIFQPNTDRIMQIKEAAQLKFARLFEKASKIRDRNRDKNGGIISTRRENKDATEIPDITFDKNKDSLRRELYLALRQKHFENWLPIFEEYQTENAETIQHQLIELDAVDENDILEELNGEYLRASRWHRHQQIGVTTKKELADIKAAMPLIKQKRDLKSTGSKSHLSNSNMRLFGSSSSPEQQILSDNKENSQSDHGI